MISAEFAKTVFYWKMTTDKPYPRKRLWFAGIVTVLTLSCVGWLGVASFLRVGPCFGRHQADSPDLQGLPLEVLPVTTNGVNPERLAILVTGDGGWAAIDRRLAAVFAEHDVPTVGWISPRYFWHRRTPTEAGQDLGRVIDHFTRQWDIKRVILIGYSRGADVLPFMVNRLPEHNRAQIEKIALLGPAMNVSFVMQPLEYVWRDAYKGELQVLPEVLRLPQAKLLCISGDDEPDSLCQRLDPGRASVTSLPGGHHFGTAYDRVAERILRSCQESAATRFGQLDLNREASQQPTIYSQI